MLGLPASAGAPALAATGGRAVAQLLPPCSNIQNKCYADYADKLVQEIMIVLTETMQIMVVILILLLPG